jgi:hypothetical protein
MDLTFAELDEYNFEDSGFESNNFNNNNNNVTNEIINVNSNLTTYTNYWHKNNEQINIPIKNSMKPLTYDDILNSLNLKAKEQGNLQFIEKPQKQSNIIKKPVVSFDLPQFTSQFTPQFTPQLTTQFTPQLTTQFTPNLNNNVNKVIPTPQQPSNIDKNSYIYNKYFKDYKDESVVEEPKKPMTREEYIQEYNRRIYEKRRIEQIKSKKLMFSRGNDVNISVSNPNHNLNKLFRM